MAIQFRCPYCPKTHTVSDASAGKVATCSGCNRTLTIPTLESLSAPATPHERVAILSEPPAKPRIPPIPVAANSHRAVPPPPPVQNPFAFLQEQQAGSTPAYVSGSDEPLLPLSIPARYVTWMKRFHCRIQVEGAMLSAIRDDGTILATVRQNEASSRLKFRFNGLKIAGPNESTVSVVYSPSDRLPYSVGRLRAWAEQQSGNAARATISNVIATMALRLPIILCSLQLIVTAGLLAVAATMPKTEILLVAAGIGFVGLLAALVGMVLKQPWGAMVAAVVNVLAIGDTVLAPFMLPSGYRLNACGIFMILMRLAVLGSFVVMYFRSYAQLKVARRFAIPRSV